MAAGDGFGHGAEVGVIGAVGGIANEDLDALAAGDLVRFPPVHGQIAAGHVRHLAHRGRHPPDQFVAGAGDPL